MNKKQLTLVILIAFFIGALGAMVLGRFVVPYVATFPHFSWLNQLVTTSPIVVQRTETVQLNEGVNLIDLIKQSDNFMVSIYDAKNTFLGNGVIVTSDGLILTAAPLLPKTGAITVVTNDGVSLPATVKQAAAANNLALLAVTASNLPMAQFDDAATLEAGQRLIYIGRGNVKSEREAVTGFVTQSLANEPTNPTITSDAAISADYFGGPAVDLSGHVVGLVINNAQTVTGENLKVLIANYLTSIAPTK